MKGVMVNIVLLGYIGIDMVKVICFDVFEKIVVMILVWCFGGFEEIGLIVVWFVLNDFGFVMGVDFLLNGGLYMG